MRRRLDRVNRTSSLVSYEERAESAVPRAKAQRVRRRMHYAMSLQCFQVRTGVPVWWAMFACRAMVQWRSRRVNHRHRVAFGGN